MKKFYIGIIFLFFSIKGSAQFSEYGGTYYDSQYGTTGVTINYGNSGPNWAAINAAQEAYWAARMAAAAANIPQQPVIPPPSSQPTTYPGSIPKPTAPNPCDGAAASAGGHASYIFKDTDVTASLNSLPPFSGTNQNESIFNIKSTNGNITTTPTREIGASGGTNSDYSASVIADAHTHPLGGAFAPSAQDLKALDAKRDIMTGFVASYVVSSDGNIYALYISNPAKLNAFVDNNPGFVGSDNNFAPGTTPGNLFRDTNRDLQIAGYSAQEAYTRATALVLQDAGVTLLKSDAKNINFKKIDLRED